MITKFQNLVRWKIIGAASAAFPVPGYLPPEVGDPPGRTADR